MTTSHASQVKRSAHIKQGQTENGQIKNGQSPDKRLLIQRRDWLRATAVSGAAVSMVGSIASESMAVPFSADSQQAVLPDARQPEGYTLAGVAQSIDQSTAVLPALAQADAAAFSPVQLQASKPHASQVQSNPAAVNTAQTSLITQTKDGNWTLSTEASAEANTATQRANITKSRAVLSDLAEQTGRTRRACKGQRCRGLAYIEARLPESRAAVEALQAQLDQLEGQQAQQNIEGYQQVLSDRVSEIAQQKQELIIVMEQNQQRITQLKMTLVQMDADLELTDRALESDIAYQGAWNRLIRAEQNLLNEFSKLDLDGTALNEIYSDYEYHQKEAQRLAGEALSNYLLAAATVPSFIERSPDALSFLQELALTSHEYRVQQLRQSSINQMEKRLSARRSQLIKSVGDYEALESELTSAKEVVKEYEIERAYILSQQAAREGNQPNSSAENSAQGESGVGQAAWQLVENSANALDRLRQLVPLVPKDSVAQGVIYAVLAAGAIAAISVRRRTRKATIPQLNLQDSNPVRDYSFQPSEQQRANLMASIKLPSLRFSPPQLQTEGASVQDIPVPPSLANSNGFTRGIALTAAAFTGDRSFGKTSSARTSFGTALEQHSLAPAAARLHGEELPELEEILAKAAPPVQSEPDDFEQRILSELIELTGQTTRITPATPADAAKSAAENNRTVTMMVQDLNETLGISLPEVSTSEVSTSGSTFAQEPRTQEPIKVLLNDVDLLAEHAVQWILKDLGLSSTVTTPTVSAQSVSTQRNAVEASNRAQDTANTAPLTQFTGLGSLSIVQPAGAVPYQIAGKTSKEFASVAA
ncbi:MAG: hypothetical protein AAF703_10975 [Cyanobacteria bacterium P01_D01_bin.105]